MKQLSIFSALFLILNISVAAQGISFVNSDTSVTVYTPDLFIHTIEHLYMDNTNTDTITVDWFMTADIPQAMNSNTGVMENVWDVRVCDEVLCHNDPSGQTVIPPSGNLYDWHFQIVPSSFLNGEWALGTGDVTLQVRNIEFPGDIIGITANITTTETVGIFDVNFTEVTAFPNPTTNIVNIQLENNENLNKAVISNLNGQIVKEMNIENQSVLSFDLTDLTTGLYHIRLSNDEGMILSSQLIEKK